MIIGDKMDLAELARLMGSWADRNQARHLRAILVGIGAWENTNDMSEYDWDRMVEKACTLALYD